MEAFSGMRRPESPDVSLTDADLDFVIGLAAPNARDPNRLKRLARQDEELRKALVSDDAVFEHVMADDEAFVRVTPALYFEVLLRRALRELETATHTVERSGRQAIPVFDTDEVVRLMEAPRVPEYLAAMLASFTRVETYVRPVRVRRGVWRKVRYNDMDVDSLLRFCAEADEQQRLRFYKRIADVCLFVTGIFRDYASSTGGAVGAGRARRTLEDYETEGRRFYGLAAEHPGAQTLGLSEVFDLLREHFTSARKPLAFIASQYLHSRRHRLFAAPG